MIQERVEWRGFALGQSWLVHPTPCTTRRTHPHATNEPVNRPPALFHPPTHPHLKKNTSQSVTHLRHHLRVGHHLLRAPHHLGVLWFVGWCCVVVFVGVGVLWFVCFCIRLIYDLLVLCCCICLGGFCCVCVYVYVGACVCVSVGRV